MLRVLLPFFLLLSLMMSYSCSSIKSGKYIKLKRGHSIATLSKKYNVPTWMIQASNGNNSFKEGEWVFVPLPWGIFGEGSRAPASYSGSSKFIWPVPSSKKISSSYGPRWGKFHQGIDIPARKGSFVLAADRGVVMYSGMEISGYGYITVVGHQYGLFTIYAHNNKNLVKVGQKVKKGQIIAEVGNTGKSTGPHLHFEVRRNGKPMNPKMFIE